MIFYLFYLTFFFRSNSILASTFIFFTWPLPVLSSRSGILDPSYLYYLLLSRTAPAPDLGTFYALT